MYTLKWLLKEASDTQAEIGGKWVPARPLIGSMRDRIRAAWAVLTGKADAFTWPEGQ